MTQVTAESFYDSLSLANKLDEILDGFRLEEIHLFSYFSSILFIYKGNTLADWRYKFTIDDNGYPFSTELNEAIQQHVKNGYLEKQDEFYSISARGVSELNKFRRLNTLNTRDEYLNAATITNILVPYSQTLRALLNDPEINKAKVLDGKRWLNQSDAYKNFQEISKAVGVPSEDLIIPAVTWVNYIYEKDNLGHQEN